MDAEPEIVETVPESDAESVEAIFATRFPTEESQETTPETEDAPEDDPELDDDGEPEVPEPAPTEPERYTFRGQELTAEQVEALLALDNQLKSDPKFVEHVGTYFNPPAPPTTPQASGPPTDPELDEYLANPAFKKLYDINRAAMEEIERLKADQSTVTQDLAARRRQENEGYVNAAVATFKDQFSVSPDELTKVRDAAAKMELVPVLMRGIDPITGQQFAPDPVSCIRRAMEIAYWQIPELRDREIQKQIEAKAKTTTRRKTSSALSGSGGSAPRQTAPPKNEAERRQAMIAEISQRVSG